MANSTLCVLNITRRLRGIHAAWHFGYAVNFGGESGLRKLGLGGTHPLTQRYKPVVSSTGFKHIKLGLRGRFRTQPLSFHELVIVSTPHSHRMERIPLR
ncbi:DUF3265 domain-containing protein [Vibrio vulnificus]|nr:DUF3265 domain-containing protein [Vibrio vulnificus]